jgi:Protein of unknown function (DUF3592)
VKAPPRKVHPKSKRSDALGRYLFIGVFSITGLGLLGGGLYAAWHTRQFLQIAVKAPGVVTENVWQRSTVPNKRGDYVSYAYPRIEFETEDGRYTSVLLSDIGTNPATYRVNQRITVLYDPRDPRYASIQSFESAWFVPLLLGGIGTVFCLFGLGAALFGMSVGGRKQA